MCFLDYCHGERVAIQMELIGIQLVLRRVENIWLGSKFIKETMYLL